MALISENNIFALPNISLNIYVEELMIATAAKNSHIDLWMN